MFATIAPIVLAVWLYRVSVSSGLPPWKPVIVGVVAFYATMEACGLVLTRMLIGKSQVNLHSMGYALTVEISAVIVGLVVVILIRRFFFNRPEK